MSTPQLVDPALTQRITVGVGDFAASNNPNAVISTYALGSCLGIIALDPEIRTAGLLHCMLPTPSVTPDKNQDRPAMFVDSGFKLLMQTVIGLGARVNRLRFIVAGGASHYGEQDFFRIGPRNREELEKILHTYPFNVIHSFIGGTINRTLHFNLATGQLILKTPHGKSEYSCYD